MALPPRQLFPCNSIGKSTCLSRWTPLPHPAEPPVRICFACKSILEPSLSSQRLVLSCKPPLPSVPLQSVVGVPLVCHSSVPFAWAPHSPVFRPHDSIFGTQLHHDVPSRGASFQAVMHVHSRATVCRLRPLPVLAPGLIQLRQSFLLRRPLWSP